MTGASQAERPSVLRASVAIPAKNPSSNTQPSIQSVVVMPSGADRAGVPSSRTPDATPQLPASRTSGWASVCDMDMVVTS